MDKGGTVTGLSITDTTQHECIRCPKGKQNHERIPGVTTEQAQEVLGRVISEIYGPVRPETREGYRYFATFTDDYSHYTCVGFAKTEGATLELFKGWKAQAEKETGRKLKVIQTNRGGEYKSEAFKNFLAKEGIKHEVANPKTPLPCGAAEQENGTLNNRARSMLEYAKMVVKTKNLPPSFWNYAIRHSVWIENRVPIHNLEREKTPYEVYFGRRPSLISLRLFGCVAHAHIPEKFQKKIGARVVEGIHIGFIEEESAWVLYDKEERRIIKARDVEFSETGNRERVRVEMDDEEGKMERWGVGDKPKGVAERQYGDLRGEKGAKIQKREKNAPKITKSTKTRPSNLQNPSKLTSGTRAKQPITTQYIPRRLNRPSASKSSGSSDEGPRMELGENDPEDRLNAPNSTRRASRKRHTTIESIHRRSKRRNPSKSSNNVDRNSEIDQNTDCTSDQPEAPKPRLRARAKRPNTIDNGCHRPNRQRSRKLSRESDPDTSTDSSPERPNHSPEIFEATTSVGEIETDSSVGDTEDDEESRLTFSTTENGEEIDSRTSESLQDSNEATKRRDAPDWRQSIMEDYEDENGDEGGQDSSWGDEKSQRDGASRGEPMADERDRASNSPKMAYPNRQDPPTTFNFKWHPSPQHYPSLHPSRLPEPPTLKSDLPRWLNTVPSLLRTNRDSHMESIPWNNAKTSNLRERNQLVGGRSEEMETDRSMIDYKPATRAPQSHRVSNRVEASVEGGNGVENPSRSRLRSMCECANAESDSPKSRIRR
jgi:hypothetical protein